MEQKKSFQPGHLAPPAQCVCALFAQESGKLSELRTAQIREMCGL